MRKRCTVIFALAILANSILEADDDTERAALANRVQGRVVNMKLYDDFDWYRFVSMTSKDVTLKCPPHGSLPHLMFVAEGESPRRLEHNEKFTVPVNQVVTCLYNRRTEILTPVVLKNRKKGFQVAWLNSHLHIGNPTNIWYVALSNPLVKVKEDDVATIMKEGKWVKFEKDQIVTTEHVLNFYKNGGMLAFLAQENGWTDVPSQDEESWTNLSAQDEVGIRKEVSERGLEQQLMAALGLGKTETSEQTTQGMTEAKRVTARGERGGGDNPDMEVSPPNRLWLYATLSLCALAPILYFLHRKLKTRN